MGVRGFFVKYKCWLALAAFIALAACCAKWVEYDAVRPAIGRVNYEIVSDDYGEVSAPLSEAEVRQTLTIAPGTPLYGVRFKQTAAGGQTSGTLRARLLSERGELLRSAEHSAASLKEDHFTEVLFDEPIAAVNYNARYILEISCEGGGSLALWRSNGRLAGFYCEQGGEDCGALVLQIADWRVSGALLGTYRALAVFVIAGLALVFWLLFVRRVKLHTAFAVCAAVLGIAFAFVTPALGAPDEDVHYITAYEYASELLGQTAKEGVGTVMRACDVPRINDEARVKREYDAFAYSRELAVLTSREAPDVSLKTVSASSAYGFGFSRVLYFPQTLGIALARACGANGALVRLAGRLFNLAVYIALAAYAVKKAPFAKAVFAVVALFPMSLQIAASMCYDALVLGMVFAFTALCFSCACGEGRPKISELAALGALALLIAPSKAIYLPVAGLLLLVAPKLFKDVKKGFLIMLLVLGAAVAVWYAANGATYIIQVKAQLASSLSLTNEQLAETFPNGDATHYFSLSYILARPDEAAELLLRTLQYSTPLYLQGVVGGRLGEIILVNIEINWLLIIALIFVAALATVRVSDEREALTGRQRALAGFIALVVAALAVFVCMTWTPINHKTIYGIQGRYLLPVLPLALLAFRARALMLARNIDRRLIFTAAALVWLVQLDALAIILAR